MGILSSRGVVKLQGHKDLVKHSAVKEVSKPKKVYFSLLAANGAEQTLTVAVGDHVKIGTKILVSPAGIPVYASVSGKVLEMELRYSAQIGRPVKHVVVENDFLNEVEIHKEWMLNEATVTPEQLVGVMKDAGLVGLGGAGFPTFMKYQGAVAKNVQAIVINAVECEPYLYTDVNAMVSTPDLIVKGADLMKLAANAKEVVIATKVHRDDAVAAMKAAIGPNRPYMKLVEVPDAYPLGWERSLIWHLFRKEYDKLPVEIGLIVNNAQTAAALALAVTQGLPIVRKVLTVSGNGIVAPANVIAPVGTPTLDVLAEVGGYKPEVTDVFLLAGGPMTSKGQMNDQFPVYASQSGYTVLIREEQEALPCIHCGACTDACPASLQPVEIKEALKAGNIDRLIKLETNACVECGLCTYVCPSNIEVTEAVRKAKLQLRLAAAKNAAKK